MGLNSLLPFLPSNEQRKKQNGCRYMTAAAAAAAASAAVQLSGRLENLIRFYIQFSKTVKQLQQVHAILTLTGAVRSPLLLLLANQLLKHPSTAAYARRVFDEGPRCENPVIWTSLIRAHASHALFSDSLSLFARMHGDGVAPNPFTFSTLLTVCSRASALEEGAQVHDLVVKMGWLSNGVVQTALVDMYSKCGRVDDARRVFDGMVERDVVSWTAMVAGYAKAGRMGCARELFDVMPERNVISWTVMVAGYAAMGEVGCARELFDRMPHKNSVSWTTMIAGYGKVGDVSAASDVFAQMPEKDGEAHAAMIACFAQNGVPEKAVGLYKLMRLQGLEANEVALVAVISACAQSGDVEMASLVSLQVEGRGYALSLIVANALIHMYGKCGAIDKACVLFDKMRERDVISYTALIVGLADHGMAYEALDVFASMREDGVSPNQITFVGVLAACSHAGLVDKGLECFRMMKSYDVVPTTEHYACIVDLLGRAGRLADAYKLISELEGTPDAGAWGSLLAACRAHDNVDLAEIVAGRLFDIEPENTGNFVILSNIYASRNQWDKAERVRKMMISKGVRKNPAYSWISS